MIDLSNIEELMELEAHKEDYAKFLEQKSQIGGMSGFEPSLLPSWLFPFQQYLVDWAVRKGKAAIFADCGLGKGPMLLTWAENIVRKTGKRVLVMTPIAVGSQLIREGEKFGIECRKVNGSQIHAGINLINYERLHHVDPEDFIGIVAEESSILKNFNGTRRSQITEFMRTRPFRLLTSATACPNDVVELGTSSEALGELGHLDMLNRFFKNDQNTIQPMRYTGFGNPRGPSPIKGHTDKWRFKGHAEIPFYQFIASWARAGRKPSDFGNFSDDAFVLPKLIETQYLVEAMTLADGCLFSTPAIGLKEQRQERRRTIVERCDKVAELVLRHDNSVSWCHLNDEGDLLEQIIPDSVQVSGSDSDEAKEEKLMAFSLGQVKRLITKTKCAGWGMNWQHCAHMTTFPSHSFEALYQSTRRLLRFGQKRDVTADTITTEGEQSTLENQQRKAIAMGKMFDSLVGQSQHSISVDKQEQFPQEVNFPSWL